MTSVLVKKYILEQKLRAHPQIASEQVRKIESLGIQIYILTTIFAGRPSFFTEEEKERLRLFVTRDRYTRRLSWEEIRDAMGYDCSAELVRDTMASMGYHKRKPRQKFTVRPDNRPKRVKWCQERLHWTYEEWFRTLFSDESYFSTIGFGHRPWVIRNAGEEDHPDCMDDIEKSGRKGVMVWGAFCGTMKSELVFVPNKVTLDSATYTEYILDPCLIPFWHQACEAYGWVMVVEDGAPGHQKFAKLCREKNGVDSMPWPAQSPDINLIERLWADMETELGETWGRIDNLELMKEALKAVWDSITESRLEELIRSMPDRLQAIIDVEGAATRY